MPDQPTPKPNPGKPADVREPSNTRPPGDPTPDKPPKPQAGKKEGSQEENRKRQRTDIQTEGM